MRILSFGIPGRRNSIPKRCIKLTVIDIFSGFLGAGKTTLIKKLIAEAFRGQKLVLIENEFGEIGIDGAFLREAGGQAADLEITEMNSGCICCSLVGDFASALDLALDRFHPDRVLIEPSGVGKLSDVAAAVAGLKRTDVKPGACITVADALRCRMYAKNFGEFYTDQIASADLVVLSRTQGLSQEKLDAAIAVLRGIKSEVSLVTTPWDSLSGEQIYAAADDRGHWAEALMEEAHHHHHEEEDDGDDDHEGDEHDHDHDHEHHHDHDHEHHHHDHDHDHDHHHHHHDGEHDADEVFQSWGRETPRKYSAGELETILDALEDEERFGPVLRAKGIVPDPEGGWLEFDYVPGEKQLRKGSPEVTGRICVIGAGLKEAALGELFGGV